MNEAIKSAIDNVRGSMNTARVNATGEGYNAEDVDDLMGDLRVLLDMLKGEE